MLDCSKLEEYIDKDKIKYNELMSNHTTIKIGGPADVLVTPDSASDIIDILKFARNNNMPVKIIGNGSKLLVLDEGIRGIVLKITSRLSNYKINGEYIIAEAGITLPKLAIIAKDNSLRGLEFASGIPGCLGGSVFMNAGAYDSAMSEIVEEITYLDKDLKIKILKKEQHEFGYRTSFFKKYEAEGNIILSVKMKLEKGNQQEIISKMKKNNDNRRLKQPLEWPSAGSTFKRPEGYFVGKLIDDCHLRGKRIGGAMISDKHSGFIVNIDHATAKDVLDLIKLIKHKVKEKFNINLEEEIETIGGIKDNESTFRMAQTRS